MPILTNPRHERFAQELAAGKSASEAYVSAGYNESRSAACRLSTNVNVVARVAELQGRVVDGVVLTKQWVIEKLIENANRAMQAVEVIGSNGVPTGEYKYEGSVANRALELLGKEQGMFVEKTEDVTTRRHIDQIDARIRQFLAGLDEGGAAGPSGGAGTNAPGDEAIPTVPGHGTA